MMKARVNIETAKKKYKPGEIIREKLSPADIAFLKKHNFIISDEDADFSGKEIIDDSEENSDMDMEGFGFHPEDENDDSGMVYKDESELQKMKKDEIVAYAASLGLELDETALKNDLIDAVLNFMEEQME